MCGFCGVVHAAPGRAVDRARLERMAGTIVHRGPDDEGYFVAGNVGLAHRRLSIVDLAHGHQPMANEDDRVWIAYNGEVYDHAVHREWLLGRGHRFRTRCDTETIVHLHEELGDEAPARLRGMFAYALWDGRRRELVLARDHTGIKPLYYATTPAGDLVFGSEPKTIFASGLVAPELDADAVAGWFALGHVPSSGTLFRGVRQVPPGHVVTWRDGRLTTRRFWRAPEGVAADAPATDVRQAADEFWARFTDSVKSQLMADVPLGVFLSGGLDSSLIVAAMREAGVEHLESFSVGFAEAEANELPWARVVAGAFGTTHREVSVTAEEFFAALPALTRHRDHPLTFSASIPLYFVSALAREHVKVVLTGEGSDELFAGYGRYPRALANMRGGARLERWLPRPARRGLAHVASSLGDGYLGSRARRSFLAQGGGIEGAYLEAFSEVPAPLRARLLRDGARDAWARVTPLVDRELVRRNPLEALLRLDQATYLEELLLKQDTMSMAASIESRVPFLDHRLVEWAATMAPSLKLRGFTGKHVVREAAGRHLPEEIIRAPKRGFTVPLGAWLRGPGRAALEDAMPSADDALFDGAAVRALLDAHVAGRDHTGALWRILAFQTWRRESLAAAPAAPPSPPAFASV